MVSKLFIVNSREIKLEHKATKFVKVEAGQEAAAVRWLRPVKDDLPKASRNN